MSKRTFYTKGKLVGLAESLHEDNRLRYENWLDPVTQKNFNSTPSWKNYDEYVSFFTAPNRPPQRFTATIVRLTDETPVGYISLAPAHMEPDLGIWIFNPHRGQGYGSEAVSIASSYIFNNLGLDYIVAGILPHNIPSLRVFQRAGFRHSPELDEAEKNNFGEGQVVQFGFRLTKLMVPQSKIDVRLPA